MASLPVAAPKARECFTACVEMPYMMPYMPVTKCRERGVKHSRDGA